MDKQNKLIRITTIPLSLEKLLGGQASFMKNHYQVIAVSSDKDHLQKVGEKEGVEVYHVEMTRRITPKQDLLAMWKLYKFFKKERPAIVHTHTPKAGFVGMVAAKMAGVPQRLHTVAGLPLMEAKGRKKQILLFVEKLTYGCCTQVYPNSKGLMDVILQEKLSSREKLNVIANGSSNGIDTSWFSPETVSETTKKELREKYNIKEKDFVFIYVGRLVSDKGINELIKAYTAFSRKYPATKLLLVGPQEAELDPLKPDTLEAIKKNPQILPVGYQQDVRPWLAISDILVFPSYREGFPNVVMQAGAMGLPAIVTNINGCNEIIVENQNGLIIPVKDAQAIYDKMELYLTNESLFLTHKEKAREMITSRYEQKVVWDALLRVYKNLEQGTNV